MFWRDIKWSLGVGNGFSDFIVYITLVPQVDLMRFQWKCFASRFAYLRLHFFGFGFLKLQTVCTHELRVKILRYFDILIIRSTSGGMQWRNQQNKAAVSFLKKKVGTSQVTAGPVAMGRTRFSIDCLLAPLPHFGIPFITSVHLFW